MLLYFVVIVFLLIKVVIHLLLDYINRVSYPVCIEKIPYINSVSYPVCIDKIPERIIDRINRVSYPVYIDKIECLTLCTLIRSLTTT